MNSCTLYAEIVQAPQLRYTQDNQMAVAELVVQFPGLRSDDPPATLKAVGWGNLAREIQETYHEGDRVVIEGRLSMNRVDRPEGFKETRAELTIQRIYRLGTDGVLQSSSALSTTSVKASPKASASSSIVSEASSSSATTYSADADAFDDIPF
ncbi:MAG: single-stranded DNA-binding protein [Cyanobacteria bacterium]|nr:single-stranded DNA-binding protein [Cyanobacteriota bacterium]MDW8200351.1 single-stranded DNA-binding protein [Cyanobacteriota bacterium SKYGB_h_bin112]